MSGIDAVTWAGGRVMALWRRARIAGLGHEPSWRDTGDGLEMFIDPADAFDRAFSLGTHDPLLLDVARRIVGAGDTCLDVGAHKGYVALRLARRVGPAGHVVAFEPDTRALARLEEHRARNGLGQIATLPLALGRENGELAFALSAQLGWSSLFPNEQARETVTDTISVPVRSLDDLVQSGELTLDTRRLRFVKIDAEGAEPAIVAGMTDLLRATHPAIWLEINRGSLEAAGSAPRDIEAPLRELGYGFFVPHRRRQWGVARLLFEPDADLSRRAEMVYDVLACVGPPPGPIVPASYRPAMHPASPSLAR